MSKRRFPKVLADELEFALFAVRSLAPEKQAELLARYRRNRVKCIAVWGLLNLDAKVEGLESIPYEYADAIERLDKAFAKVHHYRNGGAGDYVADDVVSEVSRLNAKRPRKRETNYEEIGDYLRRRKYAASGNKKAIVADAMAHFDVSESTVQRVISKCALASRKRPAVT